MHLSNISAAAQQNGFICTKGDGIELALNSVPVSWSKRCLVTSGRELFDGDQVAWNIDSALELRRLSDHSLPLNI